MEIMIVIKVEYALSSAWSLTSFEYLSLVYLNAYLIASSEFWFAKKKILSLIVGT